MNYKKKLIEVALPLEAINKESVREKSIRHGHPSTLHLWWSRKPTTTARAVIWASLIDDPSSLSEEFPTEEAQAKERQRLFEILERLVKWENSNNEDVLAEAKAEIMKSTDGNPPALLDPFAGGGSIPLEAQRLGLKAYAGDLNPVAVMINKAMIEIPPKFSGQRPVNPEARMRADYYGEWKGAQGLAEDVRYYGEWMKKKAFERIGHLYPKVKDEHEQERTVIAWIWARTVRCPNPACGCEMPLTNGFALSKKKGKEVYIDPIIKGNKIQYIIRTGKEVQKGTVARTGAKCIFCGSPVDFEYIRFEAQQGRMNADLMAIVAEGEGKRIFVAPSEEQIMVATCSKPEDIPLTDLPEKALGFRVQAYGMTKHKDLYTNRQLATLMTLSSLVSEVQQKAGNDALDVSLNNDNLSLSDGGCGAKAYGQAISVYLAFLIDQVANHSSTICSWNSPNIQMRNTFARQAIPMVWNYAECNVFSNSTGSYSILHERLCKAFVTIGMKPIGEVKQFDAQSDIGLRNVMVSTDPPYYDNIGYADLSDYFYVWLRQSLKDTYPKIFTTLLVPKTEELVATPFRFSGSTEKAKQFYEEGMFTTFKQVYIYASNNIPVTIYYAFKQSEFGVSDNNHQGGIGQLSSTGWETMLSAIVRAGFSITGTWPMRTEKPGRSVEIGTNALASSIVLVCRKRPDNAPMCTRRDFINALKRELKPALQKLQASNIAPVDMAQSAIGPGMSVFSRFSKVLEADGTPMSVRSALQIINQELDLYFTEQDGELDRDSRFCVDLYTQYAFNDMKFGEADVLARAKNTSVDKLATRGILYAQKGVVRLLTRDEIPKKIDREIIWLLTQQLTRALEKDGIIGAAKIVADIFTSEPEHAKALAYRLFTIAENKAWAKEAYAYNTLVISWPDIQSKAAELRTEVGNAEQIAFIDIDN